jgi:hypothetical protein
LNQNLLKRQTPTHKKLTLSEVRILSLSSL